MRLYLPSPRPVLSTVTWASVVGLALASLLALVAGCQHKDIPPRPAPTARTAQAAATAGATATDANGLAARLLRGGELVFQDTFDRAELGSRWKAATKDWRIEGGWVHSEHPKNKGLWLLQELPPNTRVEFDVRSEPLANGKPFPGDTKCEIFATEPHHQGGYILINGGWHNQLDVIARLDEHGKDRKSQAARPVEPSRVYHWAVVRLMAPPDAETSRRGTIWWFRDGALFMTYEDPAPVDGRYFGFNNWETNVFYDNLKVFKL